MAEPLTRLERALFRLATDLDQLGVRWALIGGVAVSLRAEPRTTRDVDVAVAVEDDREAEDIVRALLAAGYRTEAILEQTATQRLATVRFSPPGADSEGILVDLLFASCGIEPEVVAAAVTTEVLPGRLLPVATSGHLMALKVLAGRHQDLADFHSLVVNNEPSEIDRARDLLGLIEQRGFSRKKNLVAELERLLAEPEERLG